MRKPTKSAIAASLLAGGVLASAALYADGGMMSGDSMMRNGSSGMMSEDSMMGNESGGMMGMMQQMNRMMENCNKMMATHADKPPKPDAPAKPAG